jgi:hypothetical protein
MNPKATWLWTAVAAALFAFIFFFERHLHQPPPEPQKVLPTLQAAAVTSIQIIPRGHLEICAERTNSLWQLTKPIVYPAQKAGIDALLAALQQLTPATYITAPELRNLRQADQKYGFEPPQKTLVISQGEDQTFLHIGFRTAPGDQVFVQVVGIGDVYVVDAGLLKLIPDKADDWRDPQLVDLNRIEFDRLLVTNAGKAFELRRNPTNRLWHMILPGWEPRADGEKVEEALQRLQTLRAEQFVSDDPKADLDSFGLQSPELTLALAQGTNTGLLLEFGRSPTNSPGQIYARRGDQCAVLAVSKERLGPWRAPYDVFRDRHLVTLTGPLSEIEVTARDHFTLQRLPQGAWRVLPEGFPADAALAEEFIARLSQLQVADFVKDAVTAADLPDKGLASPSLRFVLEAAVTNATGITNVIVTQLDFGTNQENKIFARRADESSLYTVKAADLAGLPSAGWQLRERRIWNFTENDVAGISVHQEGKTLEMERRGANSWALRPGSQGIINDLAMDEVAHRLGELEAVCWVARGDEQRADYGFTPNNQRITVELKTGRKLTVEFGGTAPSGSPYALSLLDDQTWIFEFPWPLYQYVKTYLAIPGYIHP